MEVSDTDVFNPWGQTATESEMEAWKPTDSIKERQKKKRDGTKSPNISTAAFAFDISGLLQLLLGTENDCCGRKRQAT